MDDVRALHSSHSSRILCDLGVEFSCVAVLGYFYLGRFQPGKAQQHAKSGIVVSQLYADLMQGRYGGGEAQAEAAARRAAAAFEPVEAPEYAIPFGNRYSGPAVGDHDLDGAWRGRRAEADDGAGR